MKKAQAPRIRKPYEREAQPWPYHNTESVVDRSFGNDTDVNNIIARFKRTGHLPEQGAPGQYADVTGLQRDLTELVEESREALQKAEKMQREYDANRNDENAKQMAALQEELAALKNAGAQVDAPGQTPE